MTGFGVDPFGTSAFGSQSSPWSAPVTATTPAATVTLVPDAAVSATRSDTVTTRYASDWTGIVSATTLAGASALVPSPATSTTTADGDAAVGSQTGFGQGGFGQGGFGGSNPLGNVIRLTFTPAAAPPLPTPAPPSPVADVAGIGRVVVEVAFNTDPTVGGGVYLVWGDPVRGLWDSDQQWSPTPLWTDVTPWLDTTNGPCVTWQRGATRVEGPVIRYEAGTASVVLNNSDGRFHPLNLTGPYVLGGKTQVRPMVRVRVRGNYSGRWWPIWDGFADSWDITHPSPTFSQATISCTDAQKVFGSKNRRALTAPVGDGELSGARVNRIAASAGWPAKDRKIDAGQSTLAGTTLEGDPWSELLLVQDTEIGEVYIDASGKLVFKDRHAILTETLSTTAQAILGRFGLAGELPYVSLQPAYDDEDIRNVVRIARAGGVQQEARDDQSVLDYLEKTHERTDLLMQTDTEAGDYAEYLLAQSKDAEVRFTQITINPAAQPDDLWPQVFGRDFGDRVTIRSRPPGVFETVTLAGVGLNNTGPEKGAIPGTYGTDYLYDSQASLNFLAGLGTTTVRIMSRWERIQPALGGALSSTELQRMKDYVTRAGIAGLQVVLVVNKGARYNELAIGDAGGPTQEQFVDLWTRLSAEFANNATVVGYGNNEPHDLPDVWQTITNVATFDVTQENWTSEAGSGVTTARVTDIVHDGSGSLQAQKTVSAGVFQSLRVTDNVTTTHPEADGGDTYAGWVWCPAGETGWFAQIDITDGAGVNIPGTARALTANSWNFIDQTFTMAQVAAMQRKIVQIHNASPTAGLKDFRVDSIVHVLRYTGLQRWQDADRAAVAAIRGQGDATTWYAAGYGWAAAEGWAARNGGPWHTASNVTYEAHLYYDNDHSGTYAATFAAETTNATGQGYASVRARALAWLADFTGWVGSNRVPGLLAETGWPADTNWNPVGAAVLQAALAVGVPALVWAVGEIEGSGYLLTPWYAPGGPGTAIGSSRSSAAVVQPLLGGATTSGPGLVERDVFIRGIAGSYDGINRLTVVWTLQPADRAAGLIWDTGKWGAKTSVWAY